MNRLSEVLDSLRRRHGPHSRLLSIPLSTGEAQLDQLTAGGYPRGALTELFGPPGCGKTTLALRCVTNCQRHGGVAAWIDADRTLSARRLHRLGVDPETLMLSRPKDPHQTMRVATQLARTRAVDVVVIDSATTLTDAALNDRLRMLSVAAAESQTAVLFTNDLSARAGVYWGTGEDVPAADALKFACRLRLKMQCAATGSRRTVRVSIVKGSLTGSQHAEIVLPLVPHMRPP